LIYFLFSFTLLTLGRRS